MADVILSSVADQIVGWLASRAAEEIGSFWGVTRELEDFKDTLLMINAVLRDAEKKQVGSERVKLWLGRLEDVLYEADNLIDELSYEDLQREINNNKMIMKVRTFCSSSNQVAFRLKMAHKMKDLKKKLEKIENDAKNFHFDALPQEIYTSVPTLERDTHSFVQEEDVLGRDKEKEEIIKMLMDNEYGIEAKLSVLPIVGVGGLGKTTLAQLVFNDNKVQEHFDLKMWVCVSDDFNVQSLVGEIIKSATDNSKSLEKLKMEELRKALHKEINGKRYILVLDDVWNEDIEKWQNLKELLSIGANGSRVILTTRSEVVAKISGTVEPCRLEILDDNKSWSLFKKFAFGRETDPEDSKMVEIGKEIVKKCGGVPLAVKALGRILYFKNSESEWLSSVEMELHEISQNKDKDIVFLTLKLSYDHLPSYLKPCFCYCSLFPKDYKINVKDLIKLWMAQGYIKADYQKKCLEEVGNEYFMELLWRSLFQEVEKDEYGDIVYCKMHDLVHDLAISLVSKKCVTLDLKKENTIGKEARHLSCDFQLYSPNHVPISGKEEKKIRSIFLSHDKYGNVKGGSYQSFCKKIISTCKVLHLLDLHRVHIRIVPNNICTLKYLRYLDLSGNYEIEELPNSITKLLHLQTLKLNGCNSLKTLPKDIKKLVNLRHLEMDDCYELTHMPSGICQLTNLQTLSYVKHQFFPLA